MTTAPPAAAAPDTDRLLRTATRVLAAWGVVTALITLATAMLITVAGSPDITWTIGSLSIGWADLTTVSGWVSLAAALVIGAVGVVLLAGDRAPRIPGAPLFGAGAAAILAEYWNTFLSALSGGYDVLEAVEYTFLPILYLDLDLPLSGAIETLLWQFTVGMTVAWLLCCLMGALRSMPSAPAPQPAHAPAGWYPDPSGQHSARYWDGTAWTGDLQPSPVQQQG